MEDNDTRRTRNRARGKPIDQVSKQARTKRDFTNDEKIRAVTAMYVANRDHPSSAAAVAAACDAIGAVIHHQTLLDWRDRFGPQVLATLPHQGVAEIVIEQRNETIQQWSNVRRKALARLNTDAVINAAGARDLSVVAGVSDDKITRATALPADTVAIVQQLQEAAYRLGYSLNEVLEEMHKHLLSKLNRPAIDASVIVSDDNER